MGIKNLFKLITKYAPNSIKNNNIENYKNKILVLDANMVIYQYVIAIRNTGNDLLNDKGEITSHVLGVISKSLLLLKNNIIPVFVFDGKAPKIKLNTLNKRKECKKRNNTKLINCTNENDKLKYFKRSFTINKKIVDECKEILKLFGIPILESPTEADPLCALLVKNNLANGVISEDMDLLTFGSPILIRKMKANKKMVTEINLDNILKELNLNMNEFIDLCILLGCDYTPKINKLGMVRAYGIISEYKSIDNFLKNHPKVRDGFYKIPDNYNYLEARKFFKNPPVRTKKKVIKLAKPQTDKIKEVMINKYNFKENKINIYIKKIKKFYYLLGK